MWEEGEEQELKKWGWRWKIRGEVRTEVQNSLTSETPRDLWRVLKYEEEAHSVPEAGVGGGGVGGKGRL